MTIQRMDNVLIVVDDLEAAKAFFAELGMELEGERQVEGPWVDRTVGLSDVRADIAMMRTPDGHSRLELTKFHTPTAIRAEPENAPANTLGIRRIMFAVEDIEDVFARLHTNGAELVGEVDRYEDSCRSVTSAAPRASSSHWPSSSTEGCRRCRSPKRIIRARSQQDPRGRASLDSADEFDCLRRRDASGSSSQPDCSTRTLRPPRF